MGLTACGESRSSSPLLLARGSTGSIPLLRLWRMAMGTRDPEQPPLWMAASDLPVSSGHPFYTRLNAMLDADGFDTFVKDACRSFYAPVLGRPSLAPGRYFRLLLVGYFEGIDSERGIAWRAADSLAVRSFLRLGLEEVAPDHSTISRTRRVIDVETHRAVFTWVQQRLAAAGLLKGRTIAIDATTLEGVVARIVPGPHEAHRQDPHRPMRYDTGRPRAVIRFKISQPRTTSLPCPAGLRARRPAPMMDL